MANVRDFKYITEIAKYGSISKASEMMFLSQPTLSKFLQRVEKEVGMPLFHRVGKQLVLTPAGEIYVARSKSILELEHQMSLELEDLAAMRTGTIRLGTTAGRTIFVTHKVLPAFRKKYPNIRVVFYPRGNAELLQMMQNNELDFAVTNFTENVANFRTQIIGEDELVLVLPEHSPLVEKATPVRGSRFPVLPVEYWKDLDFVAPSSNSYSHSLIVRYWEQLGISPKVTLECPDLRTIMEAVRIGLGVSMYVSVPCGLDSGIRYFNPGGTELPKLKTSLVYHPDVYYNEAQHALMKIIQECYQYQLSAE